ncbi:hypothetical protein TNCV_2592201 [Trichonephila clavipes]|nr:hypothetical protein TNCV_2592201 [Trichonephila clavipes]
MTNKGEEKASPLQTPTARPNALWAIPYGFYRAREVLVNGILNRNLGKGEWRVKAFRCEVLMAKSILFWITSYGE